MDSGRVLRFTSLYKPYKNYTIDFTHGIVDTREVVAAQQMRKGRREFMRLYLKSGQTMDIPGIRHKYAWFQRQRTVFPVSWAKQLHDAIKSHD